MHFTKDFLALGIGSMYELQVQTEEPASRERHTRSKDLELMKKF